MNKTAFNRRKFLTAVGGASLAMPFYELLHGQTARAAAGRAERIIFVYHPDGCVPHRWHPTGSGSNQQLSESLAPLAPYQNQLVTFRNLYMAGHGVGSHGPGAKKCLTAGGEQGANKSIDKFLADTVGANDVFKHIHLGVQANKHGGSDTSVSYVGPGTAAAPEDNPVTAWQYLFSNLSNQNSGQSSVKRSVIDAVRGDLNELKSKLQQVEKTKLDLHLESVREVESRLSIQIGDCSVHPTPQFNQSLTHDDNNVPTVAKMQIDNMVAALSCGLSRVGTLQFSRHTSEMKMLFADLPHPNAKEQSHAASHDDQDNHTAQKIWFNRQVAYLLEQLKQRQDPLRGGTMLDNSLVVVVTEVGDGALHTHHDMPFYVAGGGGGSINTGYIYDNGSRSHADLYIAMSQAMGQGLNNFGIESRGPLPGLLT